MEIKLWGGPRHGNHIIIPDNIHQLVISYLDKPLFASGLDSPITSSYKTITYYRTPGEHAGVVVFECNDQS